MPSSKIRWLAYTVMVGLIPFVARLATWAMLDPGPPAFAPADLIVFGLVLHIANINELEHVPVGNESWRTIQNGVSIVFISLYMVLYALTLISEAHILVNMRSMLFASAVLAAASLGLSFSVFHRLSSV
jgi:hypothetical protein